MTSPTTHDARLLPETHLWGPGYGEHPYPAETLDEIAGYLAETTQPGYGARLHATSPGYTPGELGFVYGTLISRATIPAGYDAVGHPNRDGCPPEEMDPDITTSTAAEPVQVDTELQRYSRGRGWVLDQHGRALHPHHEQLLADDRIGLPTGLGYGWWAGETVVVDTVVTTTRGLVLIGERTTARGPIPCLVGGYSTPADFGRTAAQWRAGDRPVDRDGIIAAGARKTTEETGLAIPNGTYARIVRAIRPVSSPHTLHAWTVTFTVFYQLAETVAPVLDPATGARWVDVDELDAEVMGRLWPDHQRGLEAAL
ncbi:NUDIX hydrolase [Amycolatopsis sp. YIM 10]|uniref:NUDIX hydrolase n=1 Tax=Amycolatopsis sp. YIM 10 TaxID=2653857 RepID=UPI001290482A|nr:NUDIX hydrolase [Amycolatopsis sp. YIM 10]QFU87892.1 hypothetical protein YIM_13530 [Amycolatopsis sp. YIM 10]QFU94795.1 hypothetical protein YIM_48350 [Amycolatopsis sp. YIM 10]